MTRKRFITLITAMVMLSACSELELGSHLAKKLPLPGDNRIAVAQEKNPGYFKVGSPYKIKGRTYQPQEKYRFSEVGVASWYGPNFHGKMTANGEIFNKHELTAAHRTLQMPSIARVTNLENGRSIIVRVNDRGPFAHDRVIDLSEKAAEILGMKIKGTARVRVDVLEDPSRQVASAAKNGQSTRGVELALNRGKSISEDMPLQIAMPSVKPGGVVPVQTASAEPLPVQIANPVMPKRKMFSDLIISQAHAAESLPPVAKPMTSHPIQNAALLQEQNNIYIQAGAFSTEDNALTMKAALYNMPKPVNIHKGILADGQDIYRVKIGPFGSTAEADQIMQLMKSKGREAKVVMLD